VTPAPFRGARVVGGKVVIELPAKAIVALTLGVEGR
jgi:hypothetical protein